MSVSVLARAYSRNPVAVDSSSGLFTVLSPDLVEGTVTFEVKAVDGAGNEQLPPYAACVTTVDTTPPLLRFTATPGVAGLLLSTPDISVCVGADDATPTRVFVQVRRRG